MSDIAQAIETSARLESYGVAETTPLWMTGINHADVERTTVKLSDPRLVRVTRLRLLSDDACPFWEVSYCYGLIKVDGVERQVHVDLGNDRVAKRGYGRRATVDKGDLVRLAKEAGVYAKGIGLLDNISTLA